MHGVLIAAGFLLVAGVLLDAFQTIILPRRPVGRLRITRLFFLATWNPWVLVTRYLVPQRKQERIFSIYGPMALLVLLVVWTLLLMSGYALIYTGLGVPFSGPMMPQTAWGHLRASLYVSGTNLSTLGLGDLIPNTHAARFLSIAEAGTGLGFFALVIGYVPVLYTAFSNREVLVAMLDARAGSPPTAAELLVRHKFDGGDDALNNLLAEWERWCAGLLETHISYPLLCYYRSQHDNQSWLSALTAVLDACALLITTVDGKSTRQAELTFAVGRHALVDIGHVFNLEKREKRLRDDPPQRLHPEEYRRLCEALSGTGYRMCPDVGVGERLLALRRLYEPQALALGHYLCLDLPLWTPKIDGNAKKPSLWDAVANLRTPVAKEHEPAIHISPQAAATHLDDSERHLL